MLYVAEKVYILARDMMANGDYFFSPHFPVWFCKRLKRTKVKQIMLFFWFYRDYFILLCFILISHFIFLFFSAELAHTYKTVSFTSPDECS